MIIVPSSFDVSLPSVRSTLATTKALVFARERKSFDDISRICDAKIAYDCAFFFDYRPYLRHGEGCLVSYRIDAESALGGVPESNHDISRSCSSLDEWLWTIARHAVVKTDRAHVMIAGALLGKVVEYWTSGRANRFWQPGFAGIMWALDALVAAVTPNSGRSRSLRSVGGGSVRRCFEADA